MAGKCERSGELLDAIDAYLERAREAHRTMNGTEDPTAYLNAGDAIRTNAELIAGYAAQLKKLWTWPKKKGGA
jgi:hypothetical protein